MWGPRRNQLECVPRFGPDVSLGQVIAKHGSERPLGEGQGLTELGIGARRWVHELLPFVAIIDRTLSTIATGQDPVYTAMPDNLEHFRIGLLLRLLYQLYSQEIQGALRQAGFDDINPAAANVFTFLTSKGSTVTELATLSHVRKQTMAQTVEQLERSGYIERRPNPSDRRSQLISLTARGKRVPLVTHKAAAAVENRWARLAGANELEFLRGSLADLFSQLTAE